MKTKKRFNTVKEAPKKQRSMVRESDTSIRRSRPSNTSMNVGEEDNGVPIFGGGELLSEIHSDHSRNSSTISPIGGVEKKSRLSQKSKFQKTENDFKTREEIFKKEQDKLRNVHSSDSRFSNDETSKNQTHLTFQTSKFLENDELGDEPLYIPDGQSTISNNDAEYLETLIDALNQPKQDRGEENSKINIKIEEAREHFSRRSQNTKRSPPLDKFSTLISQMKDKMAQKNDSVDPSKNFEFEQLVLQLKTEFRNICNTKRKSPEQRVEYPQTSRRTQKYQLDNVGISKPN